MNAFKYALRGLAPLGLMAGLCSSAMAQTASPWIVSWYAPAEPNGAAPSTISHQTVREIIHTTAGGTSVRIRLSNAYGTSSLHIDGASLAQRDAQSSLKPGSVQSLSFDGHKDIIIAPGAYAISDPVAYNVTAAQDLAVSLYVNGPTPLSTTHLTQRNALYVGDGDQTNALTFSSSPSQPNTQNSYLWLSEVEVLDSPVQNTVIAFGDSITDGAGPKPDFNFNWPDLLNDRLRAQNSPTNVINAGISGNRLLHNGTWSPFGISGMARFDAEVLSHNHARAVIIFIGINDLGHIGAGAPPEELATPDDLESGLRQLIARAHEKGVKVYLGTLTPFKGTTFKGYYTPEKDAMRAKLNSWIRSNKLADGVIDFDKALNDPDHDGQLKPDYDSGDHLHPSAEGDKALANAVPLEWFK